MKSMVEVVQNLLKPYIDSVKQALTNDVTYVSQKVSNSDDEYSASKAYYIGDYVIHDNKLYKCTTDCTAAAWNVNSSCFTQDTLTNAVRRINKPELAYSNDAVRVIVVDGVLYVFFVYYPTPAASTTVATLPVGYRPLIRPRVMVAEGVFVSVETDGVLFVQIGSSATIANINCCIAVPVA